MAATERMELEVFSTATNQAVLQMPGRRFPGLVIQGDALWNLHEVAKGVVADLRGGGRPFEEAQELADQLHGFLEHYEATLNAYRIPLPYVKPS
jgi:hypothetical protein